MVRDGIRFFSQGRLQAGVCRALFCNPKDRAIDHKLVKEVRRSDGRDRLVCIDSHRAIVHSDGLGMLESAINVAGSCGVWNTNFCNASVVAEIAEFNSRCRYNNADSLPQVAIKSPAQLPHAFITK